MSLELAYFYGSEAEQYSFYRIPKVLLTDQRYKSVSMEAKVLYGLMLDRMGLSVRTDVFMDQCSVSVHLFHPIPAASLPSASNGKLSGSTRRSCQPLLSGAGS